MASSLSQTQQEIVAYCEELKALLLAKNESYGDSAMNPVRIFSRADPFEALAVRCDDKLARISRVGFEALGEDTLLDLGGYIALLTILWRRRVVA